MKRLFIHEDKVISKSRLRRIYLSVIPTVRRIARRCGYAVGVHGSLTRDCDLIAVPWVKGAVLPITLAVRVHRAIAKYPYGLAAFRRRGTGDKPHGREAYVLPLGAFCDYRKKKSHAIYVDLSIVPPKRKRR